MFVRTTNDQAVATGAAVLATGPLNLWRGSHARLWFLHYWVWENLGVAHTGTRGRLHVDIAVLISVTAMLCSCGARVAYLWIHVRAAIRLAEINEKALIAQLRAMHSGSASMTTWWSAGYR